MIIAQQISTEREEFDAFFFKRTWKCKQMDNYRMMQNDYDALRKIQPPLKKFLLKLREINLR